MCTQAIRLRTARSVFRGSLHLAHELATRIQCQSGTTNSYNTGAQADNANPIANLSIFIDNRVAYYTQQAKAYRLAKLVSQLCARPIQSAAAAHT